MMKQVEQKEDMFAYYLRDLRQRRGMTITDLSLKSGVSQSYISRLEMAGRKDPSVSVIFRLADALNVHVIHLISALGYNVYSSDGNIDLLEFLRSTGGQLSIDNQVLSLNQVDEIIKVIEAMMRFRNTH